MIVEKCDIFWVNIYIVGSYDDVVRFCWEFCLDGFCVFIIKIDFVYIMGVEVGVCVCLINYVRFLLLVDCIWINVEKLGYKLM